MTLNPINPIEEMARPARFERATSCLEGSCSIHLSYGRSRARKVIAFRRSTQELELTAARLIRAA